MAAEINTNTYNNIQKRSFNFSLVALADHVMKGNSTIDRIAPLRLWTFFSSNLYKYSAVKK